MKIRFTLKDGLGVALSGIFLFLVFRNIQFDLLLSQMYALKVLPFAVAISIHIVQTFILGWRWSLLFPQSFSVTKLNGIPSYWLGNFYNDLLPGRIGDAVKIYHFSAKYHIPYKKSIAALIAEKVLDVQTLGLFAVVYLCFFSLDVTVVNWAALCLAGSVVTADLALALFIYNKRILKVILVVIPAAKIRSWIYKLFILITQTLMSLTRLTKGGMFILISIGMILSGVLTVHLLINAAGLEGNFGDVSTCLAIPIFFTVIHFIPSAPSSVGVIHYGIYKALMLVASAKGIKVTPGLENHIILSTLLFHLVYFLPETIIGFLYVLKERRLLFGIERK